MGFCGKFCGKPKTKDKGIMEEDDEKMKIKGTVVLMKKNVMDMNDLTASFLDRVYELFGRGVSLQLISAVYTDPANEMRGKLGKPANLEKWITKITPLTAGEITFSVTFEWDESIGVPGAFIIKNRHHSQFYLKTVTLEDVPGHGRVHFVCNSWVYPTHRYKYDRVFFSNKTYLPSQMAVPLRKYREEELVNLRGDGKGCLKEWDRVYDYDFYNDLAMPERGHDFHRPVLGGSLDCPYPRRGRTGRKPHKKDSRTESRLFLLSLKIYVPRDEQFSLVKFSDFVAYALKSLFQVLIPEVAALCDKTINEFDSFQDVLDLYEGGIKLPNDATLKKIRDCVPWEMIRELVRNDGERLMKFPMPAVIKEDRSAWRTDEEFARETLAGVNPVIISRLQEFPPASKLDPEVYGNQKSTITKEHIERNMDGFTVEDALKHNKLFILNHHDALMPYLARINSTTTKTYATRTLFFLQEDDTLKPLAIELSLPHPQGDSHGAVSKVFTPAEDGVGSSIWQLAKAYAAVNDSGYHQLVSHWLNTHAVIEPFIIAANRQLSVVHPIYKLLHPHFRDTMNINALARQTLINAGGVLELTVFPGKYALEMSSAIYRNWVFTEQALPVDLVKRGMAVPDSSCPYGLKLMINDYPYAVDGLEIWAAIETWVTEYCSFYYPSDETVKNDTEIQSWWSEVKNEGHGDLRNEPWWPEMNTLADLTQACTIIIWIASAFHAAVNFGQYPYAGYPPAFSFHFFHKSPIFLLPKTLRPITHLTMVASKFCFAFSLAILSILAVDAAQHHALAPSPSSPVDCSSLILNMADCLSFVSSGSKTSKPEGTCCSGLKTVLKAGPQCLCEAFKSSASLGVTLNVTKAMTLPAACKVSAPSATQCALSLSPTGAPGIAPSAIAGAPAAFSGGANEAAPAPSPGSSGSQVVSASMGSLILGFIIMLTSMY